MNLIVNAKENIIQLLYYGIRMEKIVKTNEIPLIFDI